MSHRLNTCRLLCIALLLTAGAAPAEAQDPPRYRQPDLFTYEELAVLGRDETLDPAMQAKLDQLLTTPFLSNEAYYGGARPHRPEPLGLGASLRVVSWNIERGFNLDRIITAFTDPEAFVGAAAAEKPDFDVAALRDELAVLDGADVIVLNEADWGLKRSGYRSVARALAEALNMNWTYGVEFVEVDPITLGTEQLADIEEEADRKGLLEATAVDPNRVQALHGTAVLSRYPILDSTLTPFELQPYDWFDSEKSKISPVEVGRRKAAEVVLAETISREIRRGGRMYLKVDLGVPDVQEGRITVVATHLEIRAEPKQRREQLEEILAATKAVRNPVVIAGDMNTSGGNSEPTSLKRELKRRFGDPAYWANTGIKYSTGVGLLYDVARGGINFWKNNQDPTAQNVPVFAPNPEEQFFETLEEFRFDDGTVFDFRGDDERTATGHGGSLGNSNERDSKGFVVTFEVDRTLGPIGKAKLDWIFVKPYIEDPRRTEGPYVFAPHFGRTLAALNSAFEQPLSDHRAISVDLPFKEVPLTRLSGLQRPERNAGDSTLDAVGEGAEAAVKSVGAGIGKAGSAVKGVFTGGDDKKKATEESLPPPADLKRRPPDK